MQHDLEVASHKAYLKKKMNVCRKALHKINCTLRIKIYAMLTIFPDQPLPNALPVTDTEENR